MDDLELKALVRHEVSNSLSYCSRLAEKRREALQYYMGEAEGRLAPPEVVGRSSVVSTDVKDTIEWIMPSLLKIFMSGDETVSFEPVGQEDEEAAKQATDYINFILHKRNPGFKIFYTWFKDALLSKNGIIKHYWEDGSKPKREI